jgi:hypothetical protein
MRFSIFCAALSQLLTVMTIAAGEKRVCGGRRTRRVERDSGRRLPANNYEKFGSMSKMSEPT